MIPRAAQIETVIEFSHRAASGLTLILIAALVIWTWRSSARGERIRRTSAFALLFILMEAVIGAWLVRYNLVTSNQSVARAVAIMLHLVNTFFLLASLALTARLATVGAPERPARRNPEIWPIGLACLATLFLGASGAITALGDTLFPPATLLDGFRQDFLSPAHFLVKLRVFHPFIGAAVGIYLGLVLLWVRARHSQPSVRILAGGGLALFLLQGFLGLANVALLAPVSIQLLHLLLSALIWITLVLLATTVLEIPRHSAPQP